MGGETFLSLSPGSSDRHQTNPFKQQDDRGSVRQKLTARPPEAEASRVLDFWHVQQESFGISESEEVG